MKFPFISNSPGPKGRYSVNLCLSVETERASPALFLTPGLVHRVTPVGNAQIRCLRVMGGSLFAVCGNAVYQINSTWAATLLGNIGTTTGNVWMEDDGTHLMITDGVTGYTWDAVNGFAVIPDPDFPVPGSLCYQDTYFIVPQANGEFFNISAPGDPTSWSALDFGTVLGRADKILTGHVDKRTTLMFGESTIEAFTNTGDSDFPFERIRGSFQEIGLGAKASVVSLDTTVYWLDNHGRVLRLSGISSHEVISTPEIERLFASYTHEDARGMAIYFQGHAWYVLVFPTSNKTWVYDASVQSWFQWSSRHGLAFGGRHRANSYALFNGHHVIGDHENGKIYTLDASVYSDDGEPIRWQRTAPPVISEGKKQFFSSIQFDLKVGVGLITGHGIDSLDPPYCWLDWSDDDGRTWSNEHYGSMGKIGEYRVRMKFNRLGTGRNRTFRLTGSEPVVTEIYGSFLDAQAGAT